MTNSGKSSFIKGNYIRCNEYGKMKVFNYI